MVVLQSYLKRSQTQDLIRGPIPTRRSPRRLEPLYGHKGRVAKDTASRSTESRNGRRPSEADAEVRAENVGAYLTSCSALPINVRFSHNHPRTFVSEYFNFFHKTSPSEVRGFEGVYTLSFLRSSTWLISHSLAYAPIL